MTARRRFSEAEIMETLWFQGFQVTCFRCGYFLVDTRKIEREHLTPLALGGKDEPENCRYSHADCHAKQTNGPRGPHTSIDSDKHAIAKVRRVKAKHEGTFRRRGPKMQGQKFSGWKSMKGEPVRAKR